MHLIIGLGNPGTKYEYTRHNAGRLAVCAFQKSAKFPNFSENKKFASLISEGKIGTKKVILALPETMMNNSGTAVRALAGFYKVKPIDILIAHDDSDIVFGSIKISFAKHSAGHRGVESARRALKTDGFWRVRVGIQPSAKKHIPAMNLVLKKFSTKDLISLKKITKTATKALGLFVEEGGERAMNACN
ncbi:MAG: aminoacyl-tRNA hydrolase [Patescibacteria group bacterium]